MTTERSQDIGFLYALAKNVFIQQWKKCLKIALHVRAELRTPFFGRFIIRLPLCVQANKKFTVCCNDPVRATGNLKRFREVRHFRSGPAAGLTFLVSQFNWLQIVHPQDSATSTAEQRGISVHPESMTVSQKRRSHLSQTRIRNRVFFKLRRAVRALKRPRHHNASHPTLLTIVKSKFNHRYQKALPYFCHPLIPLQAATSQDRSGLAEPS